MQLKDIQENKQLKTIIDIQVEYLFNALLTELKFSDTLVLGPLDQLSSALGVRALSSSKNILINSFP